MNDIHWYFIQKPSIQGSTNGRCHTCWSAFDYHGLVSWFYKIFHYVTRLPINWNWCCKINNYWFASIFFHCGAANLADCFWSTAVCLRIGENNLNILRVYTFIWWFGYFNVLSVCHTSYIQWHWHPSCYILPNGWKG